MTTTQATRFDHATDVGWEGDGRYTAMLDPAWNGPFGPNGGYIAAILLNAAQAELARPELPPRIINVQYPRPATPGPAELTVDLLRAGRQNATLRVGLSQNDKLTATALVTCSAPRPQALTITETAPGAPPPDRVDEVPLETLERLPPSFQRLHLRPCFGAPVLAGDPHAVTGGWTSFRDDPGDQLYDAARLAATSDLWWPAVLPAAQQLVGSPTLELSVHFRSSQPVPGPILARFVTSTIHEGHLDEIGQLWSAEGQLLAESRQLALLIEAPPTLRP